MIMTFRKAAIAVPRYEKDFDISGPYMGDRVFDYIEGKQPGLFEKVDLRIKGAADGTEEVLTDGHVRMRDVYVVHPLYLTPARHVMVAQEISDDLHRSDGNDVILFDLYNPYFSYDKRKGKQSLNARMVADNFAGAHIERVFTIDPHSDLVGLAYPLSCPLEPLSTQIPLADHIRKNYDIENATVCSPDIGGYPRAEVFADLLDLPLIAVRKRRSREKSDYTTPLGVVGDRKDIEGKTIIFRDDVIRSAVSMENAKTLLEEYGAKDFIAVSAHLSLVGKARERIKRNKIRVVGTNTVPQAFNESEKHLYDIVDVTPIIGEVIYRRSLGQSIGEFFRSFSKD
jgi:ribose-phosphate pyrophosphokinase